MAFALSAGGIGFGIPPQNKILASVIFERPQFPVLVGNRKRWRVVVGVQKGHGIIPRGFAELPDALREAG